MRTRLLIFLSLLFCRVFITPVCFSMHAAEVKDPAATFEQVRLKKRRSSFIEEEYFHEASFGLMTALAIVKSIRILPRLFQQLSSHLALPSVSRINYIHPVSSTALFLRNRVLRL